MVRRVSRVDGVLFLLLVVSGLLEAGLGLTGRHEPWYVVATVPLAVLPVALRGSAVTAAVLLLGGVTLGQALLGSDLPGGFTEAVVLVLVTYAAGRTRSPRDLVLGLTTMLALGGVVALGTDPHPANFVYLATVVTAAWSAGKVVRVTEERGTLLAEQRVMQERTRIAGELHDVVSHHVAAIVVEAGAERRDQPPESGAARTLGDIESHGRATLTELRHLLGVLRLDGDAPVAPVTPQPGIADLPELVQSVSAGGVTVTVRAEGSPSPVGEGVSLAVYRVVQESLTNVRKHSSSRAATVTLRWLTDQVQVEVLDEGSPRSRLLPGSGFGLRAMAERVRVYGGTVTAGPSGRGFSVRATLPLEGTR